MTDPQYLSAPRLQELKDELIHLRTVVMPECAQQIDDAKQQGDLSENAEYHEAKERMAFIQTRIAELEHTIALAHIIEEPQNSHVVHIGSTVTATSADEEKKFSIVGSNEAEPSAGKISNESPLGQAFLDHAVGDEVEVVTPVKKITYRIVAIE